MYVGLKQPRGGGERYVTPARAAAKETRGRAVSNKAVTGEGATFYQNVYGLSIFLARLAHKPQPPPPRASQSLRSLFLSRS